MPVFAAAARERLAGFLASGSRPEGWIRGSHGSTLWSLGDSSCLSPLLIVKLSAGPVSVGAESHEGRQDRAEPGYEGQQEDSGE